MSPFLHVRAVSGRPAAIGAHLSAHSVNPALQPVLSRIPALSLAESYRLGDQYEYGRAFLAAATVVCGAKLADKLRDDILYFQDVGLDRLGRAVERIRRRYGGVDHPAGREIGQWLNGRSRYAEKIA